MTNLSNCEGANERSAAFLSHQESILWQQSDVYLSKHFTFRNDFHEIWSLKVSNFTHFGLKKGLNYSLYYSLWALLLTLLLTTHFGLKYSLWFQKSPK